MQRYGEILMAIGRERGQLGAGGSSPLDLAIRTTRIFRWTQGRWRQVHHHGSVDDRDALARYQQAVVQRAA